MNEQDIENVSLWNSLTLEQQEKLLLSYEENFNEKNLMPHSEVMKEHAKWLKK